MTPQHDPGGKVRLTLQADTIGSAVFSHCRQYRPALGRVWGTGRTALFVGMNPSTAEATADDPTIRREIGFARREGCGGYRKANVMDYRATDPAGLRADGVAPRSPEALPELRRMTWEAWADGGFAVAAWGVLPRQFRHYAAEAFAVLRETGIPIFCLGLTADGSPRHPLYVRADTPLQPYPGSPT